jgi:hypothetical protein
MPGKEINGLMMLVLLLKRGDEVQLWCEEGSKVPGN